MSFGEALRARTALVKELQAIGGYGHLVKDLEQAANSGASRLLVYYMSGDQGARIKAALAQHGLSMDLDAFTDDDPEIDGPTQSGTVLW